MSQADNLRGEIRARIGDEIGTLYSEGPEQVAMVYPSPYRTGMSSLGYQALYRRIHESGRVAERAFLPDDVEAWKRARLPLITYESERPVSDFGVVAFSVAYEIEIAGLIQCLELAGIPPLAEDRDERHPIVLMGGPLTFSNPLPLGPFADAVLMGEADQSIHRALDVIFAGGRKHDVLASLAKEIASCFVPSLHGDTMPDNEKADFEVLPAYGAIRTPHTELRDMFLLEAERGCSRGCKYCVMRRSTNGGMRIVPMEKILELIPSDAKRVGLVGAAVSDHPQIAELVETLAGQGREVGLSSLRPDRLNDRFVAALKLGGYRTLTTASDGASQRMRDLVARKAQERHLLRAAELTRAHGLKQMKLYMMLGLPGEDETDVEELIGFVTEISKITPLSLGIAPFVSKRNTPMDGLPFAGIKVVEARLEQLRRGVKGRVEIRGTSARWAWIEWVLAQGGQAEGRAVLDAVRAGGRFGDWKKAFQELPEERPRRLLQVVA